MKTLVTQCYDDKATQEYKDEIIKDHLVRECRNDSIAVSVGIMARREKDTLQDLVQEAMAKELALKSRKMDKQHATIEDSIAVLTLTQKPLNAPVTSTPRINQPNNVNHKINNKGHGQRLTCYNCGKIVHIARECRSRYQNAPGNVSRKPPPDFRWDDSS